MKKELTVMKAVLKADYDRHVKRFSEIKEFHGSILLGDSMMAYFPLSTADMGREVLNFGIPGDTTEGVLNRLKQVIDLKPSTVWIHIGSNDLVLSELSKAEIAGNILGIRDILVHTLPGVNVYVISITPVLRDHPISNMRYIEWRTNDDIREINQMVQEQLMKNEYINISDLLADDTGSLKHMYTVDGIHLNGEGYQVMIHELIKTI